jgi:hypothetical protein
VTLPFSHIWPSKLKTQQRENRRKQIAKIKSDKNGYLLAIAAAPLFLLQWFGCLQEDFAAWEQAQKLALGQVVVAPPQSCSC